MPMEHMPPYERVRRIDSVLMIYADGETLADLEACRANFCQLVHDKGFREKIRSLSHCCSQL